MTGKPVLAASARENVLFPDPASPVTMTRRPSADGVWLIAVSVPHVPLQGRAKVGLTRHQVRIRPVAGGLSPRLWVPGPSGRR